MMRKETVSNDDNAARTMKVLSRLSTATATCAMSKFFTMENGTFVE